MITFSNASIANLWEAPSAQVPIGECGPTQAVFRPLPRKSDPNLLARQSEDFIYYALDPDEISTDLMRDVNDTDPDYAKSRAIQFENLKNAQFPGSDFVLIPSTWDQTIWITHEWPAILASNVVTQVTEIRLEDVGAAVADNGRTRFIRFHPYRGGQPPGATPPRDGTQAEIDNCVFVDPNASNAKWAKVVYVTGDVSPFMEGLYTMHVHQWYNANAGGGIFGDPNYQATNSVEVTMYDDGATHKIGFQSRKDAPYDMVSKIDSLFNVNPVESGGYIQFTLGTEVFRNDDGRCSVGGWDHGTDRQMDCGFTCTWGAHYFQPTQLYSKPLATRINAAGPFDRVCGLGATPGCLSHCRAEAWDTPNLPIWCCLATASRANWHVHGCSRRNIPLGVSMPSTLEGPTSLQISYPLSPVFHPSFSWKSPLGRSVDTNRSMNGIDLDPIPEATVPPLRHSERSHKPAASSRRRFLRRKHPGLKAGTSHARDYHRRAHFISRQEDFAVMNARLTTSLCYLDFAHPEAENVVPTPTLDESIHFACELFAASTNPAPKKIQIRTLKARQASGAQDVILAETDTKCKTKTQLNERTSRTPIELGPPVYTVGDALGQILHTPMETVAPISLERNSVRIRFVEWADRERRGLTGSRPPGGTDVETAGNRAEDGQAALTAMSE
ncbi:hypothetical protein FB451DRAFT_1178633 [Mycena latifolia]|nr:hypothetical protein FB451DRAFT_1178633 [Mycena latifolia]